MFEARIFREFPYQPEFLNALSPSNENHIVGAEPCVESCLAANWGSYYNPWEGFMTSTYPISPTKAEIDEESRRVRRLRIVVNLSLSLIAQGNLPYEEAQEIAAAARRLAENLFPGKGHVYDLIYRPQFRRLINEVYRLQ